MKLLRDIWDKVSDVNPPVVDTVVTVEVCQFKGNKPVVMKTHKVRHLDINTCREQTRYGYEREDGSIYWTNKPLKNPFNIPKKHDANSVHVAMQNFDPKRVP